MIKICCDLVQWEALVRNHREMGMRYISVKVNECESFVGLTMPGVDTVYAHDPQHIGYIELKKCVCASCGNKHER